MTHARRLLLALATSACACAPLTYSNDGAVDFDEYRSVRVSVTSSLDSVRATEYFAVELRGESGFSHVTVDPNEAVDAVLEVTVSTTLETIMTDDEEVDSHYASEANYRLSSPTDANVDSGTETNQSEFEEEAIEDVLDLVAAHYIRPYRL
jgi:hypothetical protein